jgi:hypothetical protein
MKRYNKTKNNKNKNKKTKSKRKKIRNTFRMKGGTVNPISEFGTAISSFTNYIQSSIGSLSVPSIPGMNPVNISPMPTQQYLGSSLNTPVSNLQSYKF